MFPVSPTTSMPKSPLSAKRIRIAIQEECDIRHNGSVRYSTQQAPSRVSRDGPEGTPEATLDRDCRCVYFHRKFVLPRRCEPRHFSLREHAFRTCDAAKLRGV